MINKWGFPDGCDIIKPVNFDMVRYLPPNYIVVYTPTFELGLRFPSQIFIRELLGFLT